MVYVVICMFFNVKPVITWYLAVLAYLLKPTTSDSIPTSTEYSMLMFIPYIIAMSVSSRFL